MTKIDHAKSLLFLMMLFASCGSDDSQIVGTFAKDSIEQGGSSYFVLDEDNIRENITAEGTFADFEQVLFADYTFASLNFFFEEITFISDNQISAKISTPNQELLDTTLMYVQAEGAQVFSIVLSQNPTISLGGKISDDESTISFSYKSFVCSFQNGMSIDYSPLITEHKDLFEDENDALNKIMTDFQLMANDTIAFNVSDVIMRKN